MRNSRCFALALVCLLTSAGGSAGGEAADQFTVSACVLAGKADRPDAEDFATRISCREGFSAKAVTNRIWHQAPDGVAANSHVNLLTVKIGKRYDYLAFIFGGPDGAVSYVARAPALEQKPPKYFFSASPGDNGITRNSPIDLIANFARGLPEWKARGPVVQVLLKAWQKEEEEDEDELVAAVTEVSRGDLDRLLPVTVAAAAAAGFQPTLREVDNKLELQIHKRPDGFDLRTSLTVAGTITSYDHAGMKLENVYDEFGMLLRYLTKLRPQVRSFARLHTSGFVPIAIFTRETDMGVEDVLVCDIGNGLLAIGNRSYDPVWEVPPIPRTAMKYRFGPEKTIIGLSASRSVSIDLETGEQRAIAKPAEKPVPAADDEGDGPSAQGREITFRRAGKVIWTHTAGDVPLQPPVMIDGTVLAVGKDNVILALDPAAGKVRASRQWPTWLHAVTPIGNADKRRLLCTDLRKRLTILSWPRLETVTQLNFPFRLLSGVMEVKEFPLRWYGADELGERKPAVLIVDEKGHLYIIDPEAVAGQTGGAKQ